MVRKSPRLHPNRTATFLNLSTSSNANQEKEQLPKMAKIPPRNPIPPQATRPQRRSRTATPTKKLQEKDSTPKSTKATNNKKAKRKRSKSNTRQKTNNQDSSIQYLARTREEALQAEAVSSSKSLLLLQVMGIDEAGRGPLAGPVVAAAIRISTNIAGITDSKKITEESERERLYDAIVQSPNVEWAICVVDAKRIDEINILQGTLEAMRTAACGVISPPRMEKGQSCENGDNGIKRVKEASANVKGCYVVCGQNDSNGHPIDFDSDEKKRVIPNLQDPLVTSKYYALVDGNRLPKEMPCDAETMVKGDSKEYSIAAASILAKVTRDRLMREYDDMYPQYELARHKGYPTAVHMKKVFEFGASPIHRRTFAPLKHMSFDEDGKVQCEE